MLSVDSRLSRTTSDVDSLPVALKWYSEALRSLLCFVIRPRYLVLQVLVELHTKSPTCAVSRGALSRNIVLQREESTDFATLVAGSGNRCRYGGRY